MEEQSNGCRLHVFTVMPRHAATRDTAPDRESLLHVIVTGAHTTVQEAWRRTHLERLWLRLGAALGVDARSPVVPLLVGSEAAAVAASARLLARGLHVPAIRPPTVPSGTSRCAACAKAWARIAVAIQPESACMARIGQCSRSWIDITCGVCELVGLWQRLPSDRQNITGWMVHMLQHGHASADRPSPEECAETSAHGKTTHRCCSLLNATPAMCVC